MWTQYYIFLWKCFLFQSDVKMAPFQKVKPTSKCVNVGSIRREFVLHLLSKGQSLTSSSANIVFSKLRKCSPHIRRKSHGSEGREFESRRRRFFFLVAEDQSKDGTVHKNLKKMPTLSGKKEFIQYIFTNFVPNCIV
jgi:hypothetical protein